MGALKSKITYENKTIFGIVGFILGFIFWGIGHPGIGWGDVLILIFPCIFLIIPNITVKNSKALALISIIILLLFFIVGLFALSITVTEYLPDRLMFRSGYVESMLLAQILQLILCIYGIFCAFLLTIQTEPAKTEIMSNNQIAANERKYDKYCSKCGQGLFEDTKFCPKCGNKIE